MEDKIHLHLNMYLPSSLSFGSIRRLSCKPGFTLEAIQDCCTISDAIYG